VTRENISASGTHPGSSTAPDLAPGMPSSQPRGMTRRRKAAAAAGRSVERPRSASMAAPASNPERSAVPVDAIEGRVR
jgi:hypothetical protein